MGLRSDDFWLGGQRSGDHHRPACQEYLSPDFNSSVLDLWTPQVDESFVRRTQFTTHPDAT
jgi:hypothetical protein